MFPMMRNGGKGRVQSGLDCAKHGQVITKEPSTKTRIDFDNMTPLSTSLICVRSWQSVAYSRRVRGNHDPASIAPDEYVGEAQRHGLRRCSDRSRLRPASHDCRVSVETDRDLIDAGRDR